MILRADARQIPLADKSVQCVVTSPPYWGLRDYQVAGQIGLEPTPEAYVATIVGVMREVWRVLKDDGTVWLNLGDSYVAGGRGGGGSFADERPGWADTPMEFGKKREIPDLKPKDLIGMPWRVAFALQADGWYLRSDIIWAKPNPMPESVTDRPTRSHEYIFLLTKQGRYFYDADAIREPETASSLARYEYSAISKVGKTSSADYVLGNGNNGNMTAAGVPRTTAGLKSHEHHAHEGGRNKRDVWTVNSEPTPEAHFATFPQKLIEPCILAGTSERGECVRCGKNWVRVVDHINGDAEAQFRPKRTAGMASKTSTLSMSGNGSKEWAERGGKSLTTGWRPQCACDAPTRPNIVLDPFIGSGTVGKVCERFGRRWVGLELSVEYISIAKRRSAQMGLQL